MPRVTRAALRSHAIMEDEANLAAAIPLPSTPHKERAPLGEITNNVQDEVINVHEVDMDAKPAKKAGNKGRKAKTSKKGKKDSQFKDEENPEVLEDENQNDASSAVEEACVELMKEGNGSETLLCLDLFKHAQTNLRIQENYQVPMHDLVPNSSPSKAVQAARKQLTPTSTRTMPTPSFQPEVHKMKVDDAPTHNRSEDSFVPTIESRTPVKLTSISIVDEGIEQNADVEQLNEAKEDSFVEQIITRTPLKLVNRIEDSVEAIDALEDAIEKVGESLPDLKTTLAAPIKSRKVRKAPIKSVQAVKKGAPNNTGKVSLAVRTSVSQKTPIQPSVSKVAPPTSTKTPAPRPRTTKSSPTKEVQNTNDRIMSVTLDKAPPATKPLRVSSINKAPFQPAKSTKPPTRSTFTLPGEVIAQKLKLQREERVKREEDENAKKTTFKARPAPARLSMAPTVKMTVSSKARMSLAQGEKLGGDVGRKTSGPVIRPAGRISSVSSIKANIAGSTATSTVAMKRRSTLSVLSSNKRSPSTTASTSTTRKPSISTSNTLSSRISVLPAEGKTVSAKGKEVFNRGKVEVEDRERAKKEKEEMARVARREAAERGRVASREWAERMKGKV